jgi:hypothetical protein
MSNKRKSHHKTARQRKRSNYKLDVLGFFQADAADLIAARTRSQIIHRGGNIRSAGDEVETSVRGFFKRRLPSSYSVHHGHFLDKSLNLSRQCDIIIANKSNFPVLFRGEDGLEYLPYESVYAYGEVKSSLENKHLDEFISHQEHVLTKLSREDVPDGYIDSIRQEGDHLVYEPWSERGDLFRFLVGVTSDSFDVDRALRTLCSANPKFAPNMICLIDQGMISSARAIMPEGGVVTEFIHPQKKRPTENLGEIDGWVFSKPENDYKEGATLFYAYTRILEHLKNNVLQQTNYIEYMENFVSLTTTFVHRK